MKMKCGILMLMLVNSAAMAAGEAAYFVCTPDSVTYGSGRTVDCKKAESDNDRENCRSVRWEEEVLKKSGLSYNYLEKGSEYTFYMSINREDGSYVNEFIGNSYSSKATGFCEKRTAKAKF